MESMGDRSAYSALTSAQYPLWLGQKLAPDAPLYNMAFLFTLHGKRLEEQSGRLDAGRFQAAFRRLVQRCDALRTVIEEENGKPQQRVLKTVDDTVTVLDFQSKENAQAEARQWCKERSQQPFHLSTQLFDTALIHCPNGVTIWYLNQHHLITDMVSMKQLYEEMSSLYEQLSSSTSAETPAALTESRSPLSPYANVVLPIPSEKSIAYWQAQQDAAKRAIAPPAVPSHPIAAHNV